MAIAPLPWSAVDMIEAGSACSGVETSGASSMSFAPKGSAIQRETPPASGIEPVIAVVFVFGPFRLIPSRKILLSGDRALNLGGRALDLLHCLLLYAGQEVSKETLIDFAWPDVFVDERNVKVHISALRQALQDTLPQATYIATVIGRGYQFVCPVRTERVEQADFSAVDEPGAGDLPACPTLVGRDADLEQVSRALSPTRVLTLVGAGGVGKTSLAIAAAHRMAGAFPGGVHFVDLSTIREPALVTHLVAKGLGVRDDLADLGLAVAEYLRGRRALLILDNCEHLLHAAAMLATRIVGAESTSCVLATSREPLALANETLQRVSPLAFPQAAEIRTADEALTYSSVELFALRAREAADYQLNDGDAADVASLCEALDGLPLAIEIGAAKLNEFSPAKLLEEVRSRITALQNEDASTPVRHRSLWTMLDWSYQLLSEREAALFRLLSVFAGTFDSAGAVGMARLVGYDPYEITMTLGGLVAKSLLSAEVDGEHLRYRLSESARCYSADILRSSPLADAAQRHHARLVLATFEKSETEWGVLENRTWRARYDVQVADLRKALDWCFAPAGDETLGVDLAISAIRFWNERSFMSEQRFQVDRALAHCAAMPNVPRRKAILATSRAWSMVFARDPQAETDDAWRSALDCAELGGDLGQRLGAMAGWAHFFIYTGRNVEAVAQLDELGRVAAQAGDRASVFDGERLSALPELHLGRLVEVVAKLERLAQELDVGVPPSKITRYQRQRSVSIDGTLAFSSWLTGRSDRAAASAEKVVLETGQVGLLLGQAHTLALVAMPMALWSGQLNRLEQYATILEHNLERENIAMYEPVQRFYGSYTRYARGRIDALGEMRRAVDDLVRDGFLVRTPMYLGILAESLLEASRPSEADETVEAALALQRRSQENWCRPELLRVKARILASLVAWERAGSTLREAHHDALAMGARLLERRILDEMPRFAAAGMSSEVASMISSAAGARGKAGTQMRGRAFGRAKASDAGLATTSLP